MLYARPFFYAGTNFKCGDTGVSLVGNLDADASPCAYCRCSKAAHDGGALPSIPIVHLLTQDCLYGLPYRASISAWVHGITCFTAYMLPKLCAIPDIRHAAALHHLYRSDGQMLPVEAATDTGVGDCVPSEMPTCVYTEKPYTTEIIQHGGWCEQVLRYEHEMRCCNCLAKKPSVPLATDVTNYGFYVSGIEKDDIQAFADINEVSIAEMQDDDCGRVYVRLEPGFLPATPIREQIFRKRLEDNFSDAVFDECLCFWCPLAVCGPACHAAVFEEAVPNVQKMIHASCLVYGMMNNGSTISNRADNKWNLSSIQLLAPPCHVSGLVFRGQLATGSPCVPLYTNLLTRHGPIAPMEAKAGAAASDGEKPMYAKFNSADTKQKASRRRVMSISEVVKQ